MDKEKIGAVIRQLVPLSRILGVPERGLDEILQRTVDKMDRTDLLTMAGVADAASRFLRDEAAASSPRSHVSIVDSLLAPDKDTGT
jgi:hypothetical protein